MDKLDKKTRSRLMSRIRSKHTGLEKAVRSLLHRLGYRFRLHRKGLPGTPDIVLPKYRAVILAHGCFWHRHPGCSLAPTPASNVDYWLSKFARNIERDALQVFELEQAGWKVIVVWQCELKNMPGLTARLDQELRGGGHALPPRAG
ncbi:MAG TPA: DNA mismatch endonuclease Vsr [Humidesulfovibrio sp.]|uniref:very short patch repair endonuclease n=1 Tax=Humidesulfovibrio sp. TaxID=2910988 RepID=UPI002C6C40EA|nr:DNA mismatch endonuclease Vsr [Humidesulfovibrio sp.]HWR03291.1 DNA mismatch endonuclease Vsr [Humidesulfovibrio sp.]